MSEEDRERRQSFWTLFFFYKSHMFRVLKKSIQNPKQNTEDAILFFGLVPKSSRHFTYSYSTHSLTTTHIKMTAAENSTRTNAAGEKYSLRGIYGSEPYWPEAKLKICVTGAGGFIGALCRFLFAFVRLCNWAIFSLLCVTSSSSSSSSIFWFLCLVVGRRLGVRARLEKERARKP